MPLPKACSIEIIEKRVEGRCNPYGVIVPDEIRINGVPVLASDKPITIHAIELDAHDIVMVTLTLFARRITIGAEDDTEDV
jgi:hypothetical protein